MKKRWYIFIILALIFFWYGEKRSFYCLDDNKCITVWKTYNNKCYITSGNYYGIFKPSGNYIETTNTNNLTFFWSDKIPKSIVVKGENLSIYSNFKEETVFLKFSDEKEKYYQMLFKPNATKHNDINEDVSYMSLFIQEPYATNKKGKKID